MKTKTATTRPLVPLAAMAIFMVCGCGGGPGCRAGADCASGVCLSDGTCQPVSDAGSHGGDLVDYNGDGGSDGGTDGGADSGADSGADANVDGGADSGGDRQPVCQPNDDWLIERAEMPLAAGLRATFRVTEDVAVDTAGQFQPNGDRLWDLSGDLVGDHSLLGELQPLTGQWFAASFPDADYAARLSDREDLLGVFEIGDDSLQLLGVVSPDGGLTRTELSYDPPALVLEFPLELGQTFSSDSTVSGWVSGVYSIYHEKYESQVDARGLVKTPFDEFSALRVRVLLTRTVGVLVTKIRSFAFVAECFGTIAKIDSNDNEPVTEFSQAAEIWRLAP